MLKHGLAGVTMLMLCQICLAEPPDKALIPDSASWVAHIDVEGMMATKTFKMLGTIVPLVVAPTQPADAAKGESPASERFDQLMIDIKKITAITFYGVSGSEAQPVVIVRGKLDKSAIMDMIGLSEDKPAEMYGNRKILLGGNKTNPAESFYLCFYDANTIIGSQNLVLLRSAMDLADGGSKPLSKGNPLSEMLSIDKGTVAIVAAKDIDGYAKLVRKESPVAAAVLTKIKSACLRLGEKDEKIFMSASISAINEEQAGNVEQALKGLIAMAELACDDQNNLAMIAKLIKPTITRDGVKVDVEVKASLEDIMLVYMTQQFQGGFDTYKQKAAEKNKGRTPAASASRPTARAEE